MFTHRTDEDIPKIFSEIGGERLRRPLNRHTPLNLPVDIEDHIYIKTRIINY